MHLSRLLVVAALIAMLAVIPVVRCDEWWDDDSDLDPEMRKNLPDQDDPANRAKLLCSACHWSVIELHHEIAELQKKKKGKKPRQDELEDLADGFCDSLKSKYGLVVDDDTKKIRPIYTALKSRLDGAWISRIFHNECMSFVERLTGRSDWFSWDGLRNLWSGEQGIQEADFHTLCPLCQEEGAKGAYKSRPTTQMWVDKKTQMLEDWDL